MNSLDSPRASFAQALQQTPEPTLRETILTALHARLSALPAAVRRNEVLPEKVPAAGLVILPDRDPGEPNVEAFPGLVASNWMEGRI